MSDGPTIGALFAGYGGLCHLGLAPLIGGTVTWCSEYEPPSKNNPKPSQAAARVLAHHYPDTKNLGDITTIDWTAVEPVDWMTGGFPCTDVSVAGAQAGMVAGSRSGLWSEFARAIAALRPKFVFIENVEGLRSARADSDVEPCPWCLGDGTTEPALRALGAVLGDLADLGFDAEWVSVRASDVGAPHRRGRVFILARTRDTTFSGVPADEPVSSTTDTFTERPTTGTADRDHAGDTSSRVQLVGGTTPFMAANVRDPDRVAGSAPGAFGWGSDHLVGSPTLQRTLGSGGGHVPDTAGVGRGEGWTEPEGRGGGPAPVLSGASVADPAGGGRDRGPQGERWNPTIGTAAPRGSGCSTCGCPTPHPDLTGPQRHRGPVPDAHQLDRAPGRAGPVPDPKSSRRSGGGSSR